jgi:hypothetical protein
MGMLLLFTVVGFPLFGTIAGALPHPVSLAFTFRTASYPLAVAILISLAPLLGVCALAAALFVLHEWCHGLAFRWAGARPRYGAKMIGRLLPCLYATAPGCWLTRRQYMIVALAPTIAVNLVGIALMLPPTLLRILLVVPLALHFGGCAGDWLMLGVLSRFRSSTLFEDTQDGFRFRAG